MSEKKEVIIEKAKSTGLELLREPFAANQINKLPKPTKTQTEAVRGDNFRNGIRCTECGGWHHPDVIHLDYVGHAALTNRLLDVDPNWNWEPLSLTEQGLPCIDNLGGLWIKLTILGVTRLGYGSADNKKGGDAIKEIIGDGLRNAAMRFGAALDLWHKGDLHGDVGEKEPEPEPKPKELPLVNLKELCKPDGREYIKNFKSAQEAIKVLSKSRKVDDAAAIVITEIFEGEDGQ